jgi:hypothetical protein
VYQLTVDTVTVTDHSDRDDAHVDPIPRLSRKRLDALRHNAVDEPVHRNPRLAVVVGAQLGALVSASTLAALNWWYALPSWGAGAP